MSFKIRRILENNTGILTKCTRNRGREGRDRCRIRGASESNFDPVNMPDQPIQPESQRVAGPLRSNYDILLNKAKKK